MYLHVSINPFLQYGQLYCIFPRNSGGCKIGIPIAINVLLQELHHKDEHL